jgi:ribosome biogenesis GTPase / thiamine phosphate phosphatase
MAELDELGWDARWAESLATPELAELAGLTPARVAVEHRGAVEVVDAGGGFWAEPTGKMFFEAGDKRALPVVGDWVAVSDAETARTTGSRAPLRAILPRRSCLVRRAAGEREEPQPIAANVDVAFVVTSANQDLNPRRLERYLVTVRDGGAAPVVVVNKTDLAAIAAPRVAELAAVAGDAPIIYTSALRGSGIDELAAHLARGRTAVFVGSSGVGKSTLVNALMTGKVDLATQPVRAHDDRGKHTTTRRELYVLTGGGVLIDTPGMRELQLWGDLDDDLSAFDDITTLAASCRFSDCRHQAEPGCAVRDAVDPARLAAYQKLLAERAASATRRSRRR